MAEATTPGDALGAPELSFGELKDRVELLELLVSDRNGLIAPVFWTQWREKIPHSHIFFDPNERYPVRGDGHERALWEYHKVRHLLGRLAPDLVPRLPRINGHDDVGRMDSVDAEAAADACRGLLFSLWPEWPDRLEVVRYLYYLSQPKIWEGRYFHDSYKGLELCHGISITAKRIATIAPNLMPLLPFKLPWGVVGKDFDLPETDASPSSNGIKRFYDLQGKELMKLPFELGECFFGLHDVEIVRGFRRVLTGLLWSAERSANSQAVVPREANAVETPMLDTKCLEILRVLASARTLLSIEEIADRIGLTEKPTSKRIKILHGKRLVVRAAGRGGIAINSEGESFLAKLPTNSR